MTARTASIERTTAETRVTCRLDLDGQGRVRAATGLGFLDHMLSALGRHAGFDLEGEIVDDGLRPVALGQPFDDDRHGTSWNRPVELSRHDRPGRG